MTLAFGVLAPEAAAVAGHVSEQVRSFAPRRVLAVLTHIRSRF
jgi:hypothetical protein